MIKLKTINNEILEFMFYILCVYRHNDLFIQFFPSTFCRNKAQCGGIYYVFDFFFRSAAYELFLVNSGWTFGYAKGALANWWIIFSIQIMILLVKLIVMYSPLKPLLLEVRVEVTPNNWFIKRNFWLRLNQLTMRIVLSEPLNYFFISMSHRGEWS